MDQQLFGGREMPRSIAILPALSLLLAVAPAAPVPRVSKPTGYYFPTQVGAKWVYSTRLYDFDVIEDVDAVEVKDGEVLVSVRRNQNRLMLRKEKLSVSTKGLVRVGELGGPLTPPRILLKLPYKPGEEWDYTHRAKNKTLYKTSVAEVVEVPAGTFKAIPVIRTESQLGRQVQIVDWYAPGVGLVKSATRVGDTDSYVTTWELKSFTPGKD